MFIDKVAIIDAGVNILFPLIALNRDRVEAFQNSNVRQAIWIVDLQYWLWGLKPGESRHLTSVTGSQGGQKKGTADLVHLVSSELMKFSEKIWPL